MTEQPPADHASLEQRQPDQPAVEQPVPGTRDARRVSDAIGWIGLVLAVLSALAAVLAVWAAVSGWWLDSETNSRVLAFYLYAPVSVLTGTPALLIAWVQRGRGTAPRGRTRATAALLLPGLVVLVVVQVLSLSFWLELRLGG